jgi:integrase
MQKVAFSQKEKEMRTPAEPNRPIELHNKPAKPQRKSRSPKGQARPYRDGGRWKQQLHFDDANGKRIFAIGTGSTAKAAQDRAKQNLNKKKQALVISEIPAHMLSCGGYFTHWLEKVKRPHIAPKTYIGYKAALAKHLNPFVGSMPLQKLERRHIQELFDQIANQGQSRSSQVALKAVLQPSLREAHLNGYIESNPYVGITIKKKSNRPPKAFDAEQRDAILRSAANNGVLLRWHIAFFYGLRQGEALGLRWSDLKLRGNLSEMKLSSQLQRLGGKSLTLVPLKTSGSYRTLPLTKATVRLLLSEKADQDLATTVHGPSWNSEGFVFVTPLGTPIDASNERTQWKKILKQANVEYMPIHTARKSAASINQNPAIAQRLLGHTNSSTTMDYYIDVPQEEMRSSLEKNQTQLEK